MSGVHTLHESPRNTRHDIHGPSEREDPNGREPTPSGYSTIPSFHLPRHIPLWGKPVRLQTFCCSFHPKTRSYRMLSRAGMRFDSLLPVLFVASSFLCRQALGAAQTSVTIDKYLYPGDDLGAICSPSATTIKVWAPTAKTVRVVLFADATTNTFSSIQMSRDLDGVWSAMLEGDHDGEYYLYEITQQAAEAGEPTVYRVNDPCARGCSANSGRTLIYNPRKTDPEGWSSDRFVTLKRNVDAVLYEAHVRDFSINANSGTSYGRGKYLGLVQPGTRTPAGQRSGLDHLKGLGITHVHLLPTFDYAKGDERQAVDQYRLVQLGVRPGSLQHTGRFLCHESRRHGAPKGVQADGPGAA